MNAAVDQRTMQTSVPSTLQQIQHELKAPKSQFNKFGGFNYRKCEDIFEAAKPLLVKYNATLVLTDEINQLGTVTIITAKAIFTDGNGKETVVTAHAGVDIGKKGMDVAQVFGAASSYARKYALNGLFLIDDTKDCDSDEYHDQAQANQPQPQKNNQPQQIQQAPAPQNDAKQLTQEFQQALQDIQHTQNEQDLAVIYKYFKGTRYEAGIVTACKAKKDMEGWSA